METGTGKGRPERAVGVFSWFFKDNEEEEWIGNVNLMGGPMETTTGFSDKCRGMVGVA